MTYNNSYGRFKALFNEFEKINKNSINNEKTDKAMAIIELTSLQYSCRSFLKYETLAYPVVDKAIKKPTKVDTVLYKLRLPYSLGVIYFANMTSNTNEIP